jgi:hypothetical protein
MNHVLIYLLIRAESGGIRLRHSLLLCLCDHFGCVGSLLRRLNRSDCAGSLLGEIKLSSAQCPVQCPVPPYLHRD